ncbi:MAG: hypothetical protein IJZ83_06270 [Clostridia bacterium]|nr:hypothetical protein [Clostridia bacterium]
MNKVQELLNSYGISVYTQNKNCAQIWDSIKEIEDSELAVKLINALCQEKKNNERYVIWLSDDQEGVGNYLFGYKRFDYHVNETNSQGKTVKKTKRVYAKRVLKTKIDTLIQDEIQAKKDFLARSYVMKTDPAEESEKDAALRVTTQIKRDKEANKAIEKNKKYFEKINREYERNQRKELSKAKEVVYIIAALVYSVIIASLATAAIMLSTFFLTLWSFLPVICVLPTLALIYLIVRIEIAFIERSPIVKNKKAIIFVLIPTVISQIVLFGILFIQNGLLEEISEAWSVLLALGIIALGVASYVIAFFCSYKTCWHCHTTGLALYYVTEEVLNTKFDKQTTPGIISRETVGSATITYSDGARENVDVMMDVSRDNTTYTQTDDRQICYECKICGNVHFKKRTIIVGWFQKIIDSIRGV